MQCLFLRSFDQYLDVIDGAQTAAAKEIEVSVVVPPGTVLLPGHAPVLHPHWEQQRDAEGGARL